MKLNKGAQWRADFLRELTTLSQRYGIEIVGCGCCGSPALIDLETPAGRYEVDKDDEVLEWVEEGKEKEPR